MTYDHPDDRDHPDDDNPKYGTQRVKDRPRGKPRRCSNCGARFQPSEKLRLLCPSCFRSASDYSGGVWT